MQTSFPELISSLSITNNWFSELCSFLSLEYSPGWPDKFGSSFYNWIKEQKYKPIRTLSLFSGGGGLDIAFHDAGFNVVEMIEIEKKYVDTLRSNFEDINNFLSPNILCMDIREYNPIFDNHIDFIIGGPPCQTFSAAGRRAAGVLGIDDPRGTLFEEYVRLLKILKPKGFLFENVSGIIGAQGGVAWEEIRKAFKEAGYEIFYRILDAADYGVPQHRERVFIIGLSSGTYKFPRPTHGPDSINNAPYYIPSLAVGDFNNEDMMPGLNGKYGPLLNDIPPGLNYSFYTKEMGHPTPVFAWRSKFSDFLYKADPDRPLRTIKAQGGQYTGPFSWENRPFTIEELKRLQTFPDTYMIQGSRLSSIEQIGNSVPPQIGRILALSILDQVFNIELPVKIDYLEYHEELNFRKKKRLLTKIYEDKAKVAINNLYGTNHSIIRNNIPESYNYERYLSSNFDWNHHGSVEHRLIIHRYIDEDCIHIKIGTGESVKYNVSISARIDNSWIVPHKKIILTAFTWKDEHFIGLWKALEELIIDKYGIGDLVQLSGYYQYESTFVSQVKFSEDPNSIDWHILRNVVEGHSIAKMLTLHDFSVRWNIPLSDVLPILLWLRQLGYEVRSNNTNSQIPIGKYMIPYTFPTLNPRSLQLNKKLEEKNG